MSSPATPCVWRKPRARPISRRWRHGPPANLDMPAMTMIFRVTEPAWLDQVKPGDNIRFQADKVNGQLTVTQLEVVQ
ncbi:MAG: copper-binding protein [Pseudomonadota bacterium]|nr:copper-binding protein [Pseudomonadota bacterium]